MTDPVAFAEARLAEDEAIARRNIDEGLLDDDEKTGPGYPDYQTYRNDDTEAADEYLMCFRPRRMLREVEAGRRILARHGGEHCAYPCSDMIDLLARWAGHADYDQDWVPR